MGTRLRAAGWVGIGSLAMVASLWFGTATAWAVGGGTFQTHSYGANFADMNFGDACDYSYSDWHTANFRNDWLNVRFHGQFDRSPWHVDSMDVTNSSPFGVGWVQGRWRFYVQGSEELTDVPVRPLASGEKATIPVNLTVGTKIIAVTYPIAAAGYCGETRLLVDHG